MSKTISNADLFEVGKTYLINLPPGWLIGGTVLKKQGAFVFLSDAVHLETVGQGHAMLSDLPRCNDSAEMRRICTRAHRFSPTHSFNAEMVIQFAECVRDLTPLANT